MAPSWTERDRDDPALDECRGCSGLAEVRREQDHGRADENAEDYTSTSNLLVMHSATSLQSLVAGHGHRLLTGT